MVVKSPTQNQSFLNQVPTFGFKPQQATWKAKLPKTMGRHIPKVAHNPGKVAQHSGLLAFQAEPRSRPGSDHNKPKKGPRTRRLGGSGRDAVARLSVMSPMESGILIRLGLQIASPFVGVPII